MQNEKRNNKIIALFLIISFFLILPIILICLELTNTTVNSNLFYGYISSGHSIFIPFLPIVNLFPYLPTPSNMSGFTLGNLLDIIFIINLCTLLDTTLYHYVKVVFISKKLQMYLYIDFCVPIGSKDTEIYELSSKPENYQSNINLLENDLGYHSNKILENNIKQDYKKVKNLHSFFKYWKRKKTKKANSTKIFRSPCNKCYDNIDFLYFYREFLGFGFIHSKFSLPHDIINNFLYFTEYFKQMRVI